MNMRTLIWSVGLSVVAAVAVGFLGADYACRHPESMLARCARSACLASAKYNPVSAMVNALLHHAEGVTGHGKKPVVSQQPAPERVSEETVQEECQVEQPALPPEVIDLAGYRYLTEEEIASPPVSCEPGEELVPPPEACDPRVSGGITPVLVSPTILPSDEEPMPPCIDDEPDVPADMPATEEDELKDDADVQELKQLILNLFREQFEEAPSDCDGEESDTIDEGDAPGMQEDPDYHKQYPSCPHMGRYCPYTGKCYPDDTLKETEPKPDTNTEVDDDGEAEEDHPEHPEVDTMEFRPSDAEDGEFDPKPF